jgi:hypothetical protein
MTEVDWLIDQLAQTLDERDKELAELRARLDDAQAPAEGDEAERSDA